MRTLVGRPAPLVALGAAAAAWTAIASLVFLLGTGLIHAFRHPFWQWWLYALYAPPDPTVARWLWIGAAAGAAPVTAIAGRLALSGHAMAQRPLHGAAKWATRRSAERAGLRYVRRPDGGGLILGRTRGLLGQGRRYVVLEGDEHVALYAKTGAGKGVSFVIPNCFFFAGSIVVLDIKGENFRATAGHRRRLGDAVFLFDPASRSGRTHRWNPFGFVQRGGAKSFDQVQRIAHLLFPETNGKERYWEDRGRSAFAGAAEILADTPEMDFTPAAILRFFARGDGGEALARLIEQRRQMHRPYKQAAVDALSDYLNGSADLVNGVRSTVTARMGIWFNPIVAAATEASDFDLRDLRRKRMAIYVAVSPADLGRLRPLLALFFQQLMELNTARTPAEDPSLRHPALILLDEFSRLGRMPMLANAASYVRGFGLKMAYVVQNKAQVRAIYGQDGAADIFDNCGVEVAFATNDHGLCREVSERVGYDTVNAVTQHRPRLFAALRPREQSENVHQHKRALLLPQEVARLPADEEIVLRAGIQPLRLQRLRWFGDRSFTALHRPPPTVAPLNVSVAPDDGRTRVLSNPQPA